MSLKKDFNHNSYSVYYCQKRLSHFILQDEFYLKTIIFGRLFDISKLLKHDSYLVSDFARPFIVPRAFINTASDCGYRFEKVASSKII